MTLARKMLTALSLAAYGALSLHHASAANAGMTREQVVKELGIAKPTNKLTPEEMAKGYLALTKGDPKDKTIALTFDDGPHGPVTDQLIELLKSYHVPATFFVVGKMALKHPDNIRHEADAGDLVENHTFDHPCLDALTEQEVSSEYARCSRVIHSLTGTSPRYCRPPGGDYDDKVLSASTKLGLITTLWTDDPGDYKFLPAETIASHVLYSARPGGIVLLHDGIPETVQALPTIIESLRLRGFRFVTVDQLESEDLQANARRTESSKALESHGDLNRKATIRKR